MKANTTDLRTLKTQRAVQDALMQLMTEKDISRITVSELAQRAMINRKTFYRHYSCINDVLDEIENVIVGGVTDILKQENALYMEPHILFNSINSLMSDNSEFYSALITAKSGEFIIGKVKNAFKEALLDMLRKISDDDDVVLVACAEFAVSGILSLYTKWISEGMTGSLDELADIAEKMTVEGILGTISVDPQKLRR